MQKNLTEAAISRMYGQALRAVRIARAGGKYMPRITLQHVPDIDRILYDFDFVVARKGSTLHDVHSLAYMVDSRNVDLDEADRALDALERGELPGGYWDELRASEEERERRMREDFTTFIGEEVIA